MSRLVYLDGHATTPLAPEAKEVMAPLWADAAGNAHSPHSRGQRAAAAIERARGQVASLIGAAPSEVIFTSGATEANNLLLLGLIAAVETQAIARRRIVASAIEHRSVLAVLEEAERRGFETVCAPVGEDGVIDLAALDRLVDDRTLLVSIMGANNETGVRQPLEEAARIAHFKGAMFHSDAAQVAGRVAMDVAALDLDFASLSSHKLHGPMGVGALYISALAPLKPRAVTFGGGQEQHLRPGTLPTPLIAGFGEAARTAHRVMEQSGERQRALARRMMTALRERQVSFVQNVATAPRLPGSLSLQFPGIDADQLVGRLSDSVCLSTGSACSSGEIRSSYVLQAMSLTAEQAASTVRMYIDRYLTESDIDFAADQIATAIRELKPCHWGEAPVGSPHEVHTR